MKKICIKKKFEKKNSKFKNNNNYYNIFKKVLNAILVFNIIILVIGIIVFLYIFYSSNTTKIKSNDKNIEIMNKDISCNEGYFIPIDSNKCKKCSIENCSICYGNNFYDNCIKCNNNKVTIYENNTIKSKIKSCELPCEIGDNEKCLSINKLENICSECNKGYYLPYDDKIRKKCQKCSIKNCDVCYGNKTYNICKSCQNGLTLANYNNTQKCENVSEIKENCLEYDIFAFKCSLCKNGYKLYNGKCLLIGNYSFIAIYRTDYKNENINLINDIYLKNIEEIIVDSIIVVPTINYNFASTGNHTLYFTLNIEKKNSLISMFENINKIISISFTSSFNTINITRMDSMFFNCKNLIYIDISNFRTINVTSMNSMFSGCSSLISIKFYENINSLSFNTENVIDMYSMFQNCSSLEFIDLNFLNTKNLEDIGSMFYLCSSLKSVNLNKINTTKIIYIDGLFKNCSSLEYIDISNFNLEKIAYYGLFCNCSNLLYTSINFYEEYSSNFIDNLFRC